MSRVNLLPSGTVLLLLKIILHGASGAKHGQPTFGEVNQSEQGSDVEAILAIRRAVETAEREMDAEALGRLFTDDVIMQAGRQSEQRGIDALVEFHRELYEGFEAFEVSFSSESIMIMGNLAVEGGATPEGWSRRAASRDMRRENFSMFTSAMMRATGKYGR